MHKRCIILHLKAKNPSTDPSSESKSDSQPETSSAPEEVPEADPTALRRSARVSKPPLRQGVVHLSSSDEEMPVDDVGSQLTSEASTSLGDEEPGISGTQEVATLSGSQPVDGVGSQLTPVAGTSRGDKRPGIADTQDADPLSGIQPDDANRQPEFLLKQSFPPLPPEVLRDIQPTNAAHKLVLRNRLTNPANAHRIANLYRMAVYDHVNQGPVMQSKQVFAILFHELDHQWTTPDQREHYHQYCGPWCRYQEWKNNAGLAIGFNIMTFMDGLSIRASCEHYLKVIPLLE